jgi:alpha-L-rhamnosidase
MNVANLLCEYTSNPLGIETTLPRFSWIIEDPERGQMQSAYQLLVASSQAILQSDQGDLWDSGKVESDQSVNVVYAGNTLESGKTYYWKVRVWDKDGQASPYSAVAMFEMGLLRPEDWQGNWISWSDKGGPVFRKEFTLDKPVARARLYISGLGYYEARLNGCKVGEHVLDPGWTDYDKTILYSTFDVTQALQLGSNVIGVMLGNGRFAPPDEVVKKNPNVLRKYGQQPLVIVQLNMTFADGTTLRICSDPTWKVTSGPIVFNDIYDGEIYDARLEKPGWDCPGYDDSGWAFADNAHAPQGELFSQATCPPIKVCHTILPQKLTIPKPNVFVYDFGQNFTGWVRLHVTGPQGTQVTIRHAELLHEDGTINAIPNRAANATEIYILKGEGLEVFEPRFTYHGFQYVELTGFPGTPSLESIEGRVVHSAVEPRGSFLCSHPVINQIHQNILWGQLSNLMSIPTDCPQRDERMGWMGDAQLTAEEAVHNFDMAGFYTKWLHDIRDAQKEDGSVPDVVPMYWPIAPADPAWGTACLVIPWTMYLYYGDQRILEQYYPLMTGYVGFLDSFAENDVLSYGKYGDWCPPWHVNSVDTPQDLVSQWCYYHDTLMLSKIAGILNKTEDARKYAARAKRIKAAFNQKFLKGDRYAGERDPWHYRLIPSTATDKEKEIIKQRLARIFDVRSQTGHVLALVLDLVPTDRKEAVLKSLIEDIVVIHGNHFNTGIVGTRYILDVLSENGYAELAFKLMTGTTYPGFGYMIKEGATTLWERWEYLTEVGMNSQNHIMLGSVDAWFYRFLAGIQIDPSTPGWQQIRIKPHILGDLQFASASLQTVRGLVSSRWTKGYNSLEFQVTVPVNSQAIVSVPTIGLEHGVIKESGTVIWENGTPGQRVAGISGGNEETNYVTFDVGSGTYCFEVREQ